jgi:histidine triad (HIT) family protein
MSTVFGKIVRGEIPCDKVFENERILAFKDIAPKAPVHLLIIPKKEIRSLEQVAREDFPLVAEMMQVAQQLAREFSIADGYRLVVNNGKKGGQVVEHLHLHLLGGGSFSSHLDLE